MKIETERIYSNYLNFMKEKRELKSIYKRFSEKTRQCAVEYADRVSDYDGCPFTMGRDKRPVDFFKRLYHIKYESELRILPYDTSQ